MMPAFNAEQFIGQAIESVRAQNYPLWELVIVDDGSHDHTSAIAASYADSRIRLIRQENRGEAAARNMAVEHMQGEFLAFLDADDLYLPHHLEDTVAYLSSRPEVDGVYADGYYIDAQGKRLKRLSSRRRGPFEGRIFEEVVFGSDVFGPPACVVLRVSVILEHRLRFDENIVIGPDWDFFTRYAEKGHFGYLDKITCLYRVHSTNVSVRTGLDRRALELAKCRINATQLRSFAACSERTRFNVYYDLLLNLLGGRPERQTEIVKSTQFRELPAAVQARLLRLMAGQLLLLEGNSSLVGAWLRQARQLSPGDARAALAWAAYVVSPRLLELLLRLRTIRRPRPGGMAPFADLRIESNA